jgi:mannosyltransferase
MAFVTRPHHCTPTTDDVESVTAPRAAAAVAALTVVGAILRVPGLDSGLWFDEIVTLIESVRLPVRTIVTAFPGYNNHPLYSLLAHGTVSAFGEQAWSLRLPAFAFGVISIPLLYLCAVAVTTRTEALLATLLLVVSYHHVWFSQNARGYTALLCFTLAATWLLVRLIERPRAGLAVAYGLFVALGFYTHLTMGFVAVVHASVWGTRAWSESASATRRLQFRTLFLAIAVAGVLSALMYLPMARQIYTLLSGPRPATSVVATPKWAALEALRGLRVGFGTVGVLAALGLFAVGALSYARKRPVAAALFVLPGVVTALVMLAGRLTLRPRFFFSFLGFGLLILVRGAIECGRGQRDGAFSQYRGIIGRALVGLIAAISIVSLGANYRYPKQDYGAALEFIERNRLSSDVVVTAGLASYPYTRYYQQPWTAIERPDELEPLRNRTNRVWVVYSFEEYMDPGLVGEIHRSCNVRHVFRGTLGGGDVIVCTLERPPV